MDLGSLSFTISMVAITSYVYSRFLVLTFDIAMSLFIIKRKLMHVLMTSSAFFFIFLLLTLLLTASSKELSQIEKDKNALIAFITQIKLPYNSKYNWNKSQAPCTWPGVGCLGEVAVITLRIPGASLLGKIPEKTLGNITSLQTLSLHDNGLSGPIPDDFANLAELSNVFLHNNNLNGEFPSSVANWTNLIQLDVSGNDFTGSIPFTINKLTHIQDFSVSNNKLTGRIPSSLAKLPATAFSQNVDLCGKPLSNTCDPKKYPPEPSSESDDENSKKKLSTVEIVALAIGSALILLILLICLGKRWNRAKKEKKATGVATMEAAAVAKARGGFGGGVKEKKALGVATMAAAAAAKAKAERGFGGGGEAGTSSSKNDVTSASADGERNKLVFLEGGVYSFDLEDLLRASCEVLGKGSAGTSYKTVLEERTTVVVKRLKDVVVSEKEFDSVMEGLGKMKNENVVPIWAYYYSKDLKWLVSDYFPAGSLSALLHGSIDSGRTPLYWDHRFRIALSAARGVAYLHVAGKVVHGNIKSSNILLRQDSNQDAYVSDFGLNTLFGGSSSPNTRVTSYHAPEVLETRKFTFKSDVYSFGVLLLELLTGKAPDQASLGEEGIELPRWVQSVVREEWTAKVFDVELMRYHNFKEEMVQLLQIAMPCVSIVPDQRPAMQEVVRMMEDMNRAETDDGMRQSSDDPSKGSDGHTPPAESRNSPTTVTQ